MKFNLSSLRRVNDFSVDVEFKNNENNHLIKVAFIDKKLTRVLFTSRDQMLNFQATYWWCPQDKSWAHWGDLNPGGLGGPPLNWCESYWEVITKAEQLSLADFSIQV